MNNLKFELKNLNFHHLNEKQNNSYFPFLNWNPNPCLDRTDEAYN